METNNKPTVSFGRVRGWEDYGDHGMRAVLDDIEDHPRLGNERIVHTSRVESICYTEDGKVAEIITRNTRYIRR